MTWTTVEQVMRDLNNSMAVLREIERLPMPLSDEAELRRSVHRYIVSQAMAEVQAIQDARAVIKRAKEFA